MARAETSKARQGIGEGWTAAGKFPPCSSTASARHAAGPVATSRAGWQLAAQLAPVQGCCLRSLAHIATQSSVPREDSHCRLGARPRGQRACALQVQAVSVGAGLSHTRRQLPLPLPGAVQGPRWLDRPAGPGAQGCEGEARQPNPHPKVHSRAATARAEGRCQT